MDTWGISGPQFLLLYAGIAGTVLVVALIARRVVRSGAGDNSGRTPTPIQLAYLTGGAQRALLATTAGLRAAEAITSGGGGRLAAVGPLPAGANRLDRAVHDAAAREVLHRQLDSEPHVAAALAELRDETERAGWALTPAQRRLVALPGLAMSAVLGLGIIRLIAGANNDKPFGYLLVMAIGVFVVSVVLLVPVRLSRPGRETVAAARSSHVHLAPSQSPSWTTYGPTGAVTGVALFGGAAIWAADPLFARAAGVPRQSTGSGGDGGGGGGDGGGGCGGGGGGCGG